MLYQLNHETAEPGAGQIVGLICSREDVEELNKCVFEVQKLEVILAFMRHSLFELSRARLFERRLT